MEHGWWHKCPGCGHLAIFVGLACAICHTNFEITASLSDLMKSRHLQVAPNEWMPAQQDHAEAGNRSHSPYSLRLAETASHSPYASGNSL